jgi:plastocyanin
MDRMRRTIIALLVAAAALAGCGGDDDEQSASTPTPTATAQAAAGGATVKLSAPADGAIKFDQSSLSTKAGKVTIKFANPSSVPHAVEIEGHGVEAKTDVVTKSDASVSADLKPGTYEFYCPVGDHKALGMEGKLTVK